MLSFQTVDEINYDISFLGYTSRYTYYISAAHRAGNNLLESGFH